MLRELICEGADCHAISRELRTPLLDLIAQCFEYHCVGIKGTPASNLAHWVEELDNCGVDLEGYGRTETMLLEQGFVSSSFRDWAASPDPRKPKVRQRVAGLKYGRRPSEWEITIERCEDPRADDLEQSIAGGWIEDSEVPSDDYAESKQVGVFPSGSSVQRTEMLPLPSCVYFPRF